MNVQATVTLPEELLLAVDEQSGAYGSRSRLIEVALRRFLGQSQSADAEARDRALIEQHLDELNAEAEDALGYQVPL